MLHNAITVWYVHHMIIMYYTMATRNMNSIEDTIISNIYEKAKYHNIFPLKRKYYYTKNALLDNLKDMFGSTNILRWMTPYPYTRNLVDKYMDPKAYPKYKSEAEIVMN